MAMLSQSSVNSSPASTKKKLSFADKQRLAKQRAYEKQARRKKIKLQELTVFTQQIASMLEAGLPLVQALEALQEQTENPVFRIIIREVRNDISSGTSFSEAVRKFPRAFPNLFISMIEAGEASGALADIMARVASYFEDSLRLTKKVKSAMAYPIAVISLAFIIVNILLIWVIPVFAGMYGSFGGKLPAPTQMLIDMSDFLRSYILLVIAGVVGIVILFRKLIRTPKGREIKDAVSLKLPIFGNLTRKINVARFCRTYATLLQSGVPILRTLEICSNASGNVYIERACHQIIRHISQGGQLSDIVAVTPYFPPMVKHMSRAGEQTGNVDGMMNKIADFYDSEVNNIVNALTSLMEPILICVLGVIIGGIVIAMYLPIFQMSSLISK